MTAEESISSDCLSLFSFLGRSFAPCWWFDVFFLFLLFITSCLCFLLFVVFHKTKHLLFIATTVHFTLVSTEERERERKKQIKPNPLLNALSCPRQIVKGNQRKFSTCHPRREKSNLMYSAEEKSIIHRLSANENGSKDGIESRV